MNFLEALMKIWSNKTFNLSLIEFSKKNKTFKPLKRQDHHQWPSDGEHESTCDSSISTSNQTLSTRSCFQCQVGTWRTNEDQDGRKELGSLWMRRMPSVVMVVSTWVTHIILFQKKSITIRCNVKTMLNIWINHTYHEQLSTKCHLVWFPFSMHPNPSEMVPQDRFEKKTHPQPWWHTDDYTGCPWRTFLQWFHEKSIIGWLHIWITQCFLFWWPFANKTWVRPVDVDEQKGFCVKRVHEIERGKILAHSYLHLDPRP